MPDHKNCPWNQPDASTWLSGNDSIRRVARLVEKTLDNDPRQFPIQMRAATTMVILLCRAGMWPAHDQEELNEVIAQARRNLTMIRELYSVESKRREEVGQHQSLHRLLKGLEAEMRILDARMSESPLNIPDEPPESWGLTWPKP